MNKSSQPLRFETRERANAWLAETGHYGRFHEAGKQVLIVRFDKGQTWAFADAETLVSLPNW